MKSICFRIMISTSAILCFSLFLWSCAEPSRDSNLSGPPSQQKELRKADYHSGKPLVLNPVTTTDTANNVVLTVLKNWTVYGRDRMLSSGFTEDAIAENCPPWTNLGQLAYVTGDTVCDPSNLKTLYRMWNSSIPDHMSTWNPNEVGPPSWIVDEFSSCKIWDGSKPNPFPAQSGYGSELLYRYYAANGDHDAAFISAPPAGYTREPYPLGWAFKRYGLVALTANDVMSCNGIYLGINKVAGGCVWSLTWNGKQFVNQWMDQGFGREIAIDLYRNNHSWDCPSEAGDDIGWTSMGKNAPEWLHGSPLTYYSLTGGPQPTLTTEVFPLLYQPEYHYVVSGLDPRSHPVMWRGRIGKTVTMGLYAAQGYPNIIKWTSTITLPKSEWISVIEPMSAHLNNEFDHFYLYDPATGVLTREYVPANTIWDPSVPEHLELTVSDGGAIISTSDGNYAFGVYKNFVNPPDGSCSPGFMLLNYTDGTGIARGSQDYKCSKIGWEEYPQDPDYPVSPAYSRTFYLIVGTLSQVEASMHLLYKIRG